MEHLNARNKGSFQLALGLLNAANSAIWANSIGQQFSAYQSIDTSIFFKAMEFVLGTNKNLSDEQLSCFFTTLKRLEEFFYTVDKYDGEYYVSEITEFILLGVPYSIYNGLPDGHKTELSNKYSRLYLDYGESKMEVSEFVSEAKNIMVNFNKTREQLSQERMDEATAEMKVSIRNAERENEILDEISKKLNSGIKLSMAELDFIGCERTEDGKIVDKANSLKQEVGLTS